MWHNGIMGSVASWDRWDTGSIPSQVQCFKDAVLPQLWLRSQLRLRSDPWPRSSICGVAKNEKKKKSPRGLLINEQRGHIKAG